MKKVSKMIGGRKVQDDRFDIQEHAVVEVADPSCISRASKHFAFVVKWVEGRELALLLNRNAGCRFSTDDKNLQERWLQIFDR